MTRKRFIKLLMAKYPKWYDRNRANFIADMYSTKWRNKSYAESFEDIKRWNEEEYWN